MYLISLQCLLSGRENLARCLERFDDYCRKNMPEVERYAVYIQNVLLVFFPNFETSYVQLDSFFKSLDFPGQTVSVEYSRMRYTDLKTLLTVLIKKLKRYDILYFIDGTDAVPNFNYGQIVDRVNRLVPVLADKNAMGREDTVAELKKILSAISNKDFCCSSATILFIPFGNTASLPHAAGDHGFPVSAPQGGGRGQHSGRGA